MVQKSSNGLVWEDIIQTNGAGNSNSIINYFEIDYNPYEGTNYYRIKQVDYDGRVSYSQIQVVKSYNELAGELNLYPNPCDGAFHLQLSAFGDEEYLIVVRDITGRESFSKVIITSTDNHIEAIDLSGKLAAGTYIVTASSRNEFYSQKLIVK